ncbi:MAG: NPXTG-anchored protein [Oscillospiraceae bacterium]
MKKLFASIASICAAAALAVTASAYTVDLDTGVFWNSNTVIPSEEFADCTTDTTVVFSITTDESLAEMKGHEYWCVKPMVNDSGWPFLKNLIGLELSEGGDSYPVPVGTTEMKFRFTEEELELVQNAGMALMGHGVVISEMTFTDEPLTPAAPAESGDEKGSPDTGVEGVAAVAGAAVAAAGVMVLTRKRK